MHTIFWFENLTGESYSVNIGTNRRMILERSLAKYDVKGVEWIHLA